MITLADFWTEKMNIGIEPLDDHHRTMVRLLLEVKAEADGKRHADDVKGILAALTSYSKYHFLSEERIMLEKGFPQLEQQRAEHRWFVERLDEITAEFVANDLSFKNDLLIHLKNWFVNHILTRDILLKQHISSMEAGKQADDPAK
jgi:hemerythrin-like metal-binding protein